MEQQDRIDEIAYRNAWAATIPLEFSYRKQRHRNPEDEAAFEGETKLERSRRRHQSWYVLRCTPRLEGDEFILEQFENGIKIRDIPKLASLPECLRGITPRGVRERLISCHRDGTPPYAK